MTFSFSGEYCLLFVVGSKSVVSPFSELEGSGILS